MIRMTAWRHQDERGFSAVSVGILRNLFLGASKRRQQIPSPAEGTLVIHGDHAAASSAAIMYGIQMNDRKIILDSIRVIFQAVRLSSKSTELSLGLSAAQLFVLQKLEEKEGLSINELARGTLTHQSSVSVVVSKLVASGLVCRSVSKRDRRRIELTLTEKGREVLSGAPEALQTRLIKALDEFSAAERLRLGSLLARWIRSAGISSRVAPLFGEETGETR
jgi:DNA-binding MarR family transcriptional regulator